MEGRKSGRIWLFLGSLILAAPVRAADPPLNPCPGYARLSGRGPRVSLPEGIQVPADPALAIPDLAASMTAVHANPMVRELMGTIAHGTKATDTQKFLEDLSAKIAEHGGRKKVIEVRNELEGISSLLRALRTRLLALAHDHPNQAAHFRARAEEVQHLYEQNQAKLGKMRLAIAFDSWKEAERLGLADVRLMSGKEVDRGIREYQNPARAPDAIEDAPAMMIQVKYDHDQLVQMLREGKIDEPLYYALTFARRTNSENATTAFGASWYPADGNYGRTDVIQETGNVPIQSGRFEGRLDGNGGGWVRATPPKGSFMAFRLEAPKNADKFADEDRHALVAQDGRAVQGVASRPEYHWISRDSKAGAGKGLDWVHSVFGPDLANVGLPFTSYDREGVTSLFGGLNGVPAQKWSGGSTLSNPVGTFIASSFSELRDARFFFETSLDVVPGARGTIRPNPADPRKPIFVASKGKPDLKKIGRAAYEANLKKADALLASMKEKADQYVDIIDKYRQRREAKEERATYLDFIRFLTEVTQLHEARKQAADALTELGPPVTGRALASAPAVPVHIHPEVNLTPAKLAELREHQSKHPGSFFRFDSKSLEVIRDLEQRRQNEIASSKAKTAELSHSMKNEFDFVVFDGLVGSYLAQKLVESGVPPGKILLVGQTESPFLNFAGVGSFETANRTLLEMGVDLKRHAIGRRPEGTLVPSTTAPAEANLNALQNFGIPHAFGNLSAERQANGVNKYFVTDPETGARAEIHIGQELFYGPGLAYPKSAELPNVMDDKTFYKFAQDAILRQVSTGKSVPILPPGKDVLFIGTGGAQASAEKLRFGDYYYDAIAAGEKPGKTYVVGSAAAFNNEARFSLSSPRKGLADAGLFQLIEGRVDAPQKAADAVLGNDVVRLPNGRYQVTPYRMNPATKQKTPLQSVEVDYIINATASVMGQPALRKEAAEIAPEGFTIQTAANGGFLGLKGNGTNNVTVIGPAAAILGGGAQNAPSSAIISAASARLHQGNGTLEGQPTLPIPIVGPDGKYIFDIGPFGAQGVAASTLATEAAARWRTAHPRQ